MRLLLFTGRLGHGGAERQLTLLAARLAAREHEVTFCTLYPGGVYWNDLATAGVERVPLYRDRSGPVPATLARLAAAPRRLAGVARRVSADVVYSALEVPNLLAGLADLRRPLVWGVRNTGPVGWKVRMADRMNASLSRRVPLVICNSWSGRAAAERRGYRPGDWAVVPNGFDAEVFRPAREAAQELRTAWLGGLGGPLIGLVGRLDPRKGHEVFLAAAGLMAADLPGARFVVAGGGAKAAAAFGGLADRLGIADRVVWAGDRTDMTTVYGALDLVISASLFAEGLPNVLGEALACGVPCLATDVGDAARIVDDPRRIVPPGDPDALAAAALLLLAEGPAAPDPELRAAIERRYSVDAMVAATEQALIGVVAAGRGSAP